MSRQENIPRRVLIVDDEVTIVEGLQKLFDWQAHGFEVVATANDGLTAVQAAVSCQPQLILMDINMPLLSGLEAIRQIRERLPNTAFIILSGYNDFEYARQALRLEVAEYLLKPVKFSELENALARMQAEALIPAAPCEESKTVYRISRYLAACPLHVQAGQSCSAAARRTIFRK